MTTVYIDSLLVLNLIINYLLLLLAARLAGIPFKRWRLGLGALLGAGYALLVVLPNLQWLAGPWVKCLISIPIVMVALGIKQHFGRGLLLFWVSSFLLAGLVLGLGLLSGSTTNGIPYVPVSLPALLLTASIAYVVLTAAFKGYARYGGGRAKIVPVEVTHGGQCVRFDALVDTGHALTDPMTGQSVLVVDLLYISALLPRDIRSYITPKTLKDPIGLLEELQLINDQFRFRLIPYHTIDTAKGWLLAFRPETVLVAGKPQDKLLIALSPTGLSQGKPYAALMGS